MNKLQLLSRGRSVHPIHLAELIATLKSELVDAAKRVSGDKIFRVADATIEIGVRFNRAHKAGGSFGFVAEVVDTAESSHRLQIRLVPASADEIERIETDRRHPPLVQGTRKTAAAGPAKQRDKKSRT